MAEPEKSHRPTQSCLRTPRLGSSRHAAPTESALERNPLAGAVEQDPYALLRFRDYRSVHHRLFHLRPRGRWKRAAQYEFTET